MNCDRIEYLLPAYMERDLLHDERREVEMHLAGCSACREALAGFETLEAALIRRREEVPAAGALCANVRSVLGFSRARKIRNTLLSLPGMVSLSFLLIGIILWIHRSWTESLFLRDLQLIEPLSRAAEMLTNGIIRASGGDVWVLLTAYLALTVVILLVTGKIVINFVRAD